MHGPLNVTTRTVHTTFAATLTTTHPKTRCRKPYGATHTCNAPDDGCMYCRSTRQLNAIATRAHARCYSRQNHTAAILLSRLRDPVKNGAGIAQSVQWIIYRLNHWEIEARFPVGGRDLFSSQKSTYQAWCPHHLLCLVGTFPWK